MIRQNYETPITEVMRVETEGSLCDSATFEAQSPTKEGATTEPQVVNNDFKSENDFGSGDWD